MWSIMKRFYNYLKYFFTTDISEIKFTFLHIITILIALIWSIILFLVLPVTLLKSLF